MPQFILWLAPTRLRNTRNGFFSSTSHWPPSCKIWYREQCFSFRSEETMIFLIFWLLYRVKTFFSASQGFTTKFPVQGKITFTEGDAKSLIDNVNFSGFLLTRCAHRRKTLSSGDFESCALVDFSLHQACPIFVFLMVLHQKASRNISRFKVIRWVRRWSEAKQISAVRFSRCRCRWSLLARPSYRTDVGHRVPMPPVSHDLPQQGGKPPRDAMTNKRTKHLIVH